MRIGVLAAIAAASFLAAGTAWSDCLPSQSHHCVDLAIVPQISQDIVAGERIVAPPKTAPTAEPQPAYTGPTVGLSPTVRPTPTVGYRWSID
ncbi:MAG: hypothetical protein WA459_17205 [Stellaceae bacterium]